MRTSQYFSTLLRPYQQYLFETGNSFLALGRLAFGGLLQPDMQNRFPLTWSDRAAKVDRIKPWTANLPTPLSEGGVGTSNFDAAKGRFAVEQEGARCPACTWRDIELTAALGLMNGRTAVTAWIVDTSIEWDHQLFRGFLRISVNVTDHFDPS